MSSDRFRKRNYASPQKTQTSIISYNLQKKVNHNPTPDRPLMRSFNSITGSSRTSLSPPHQQLKLSNNPFNPLSDQEEEEEATEVDSPSPSKSPQMPSKNSQSDTASISSETDLSSAASFLTVQERTILPRKVQHALRKLRMAKKVLMDTSFREEIESALGEGSFHAISTEMVEGVSQVVGKENKKEDVEMEESKNEDPLISQGESVDIINQAQSAQMTNLVIDLSQSSNAGSTKDPHNFKIGNRTLPNQQDNKPLGKSNSSGVPIIRNVSFAET